MPHISTHTMQINKNATKPEDFYLSLQEEPFSFSIYVNNEEYYIKVRWNYGVQSLYIEILDSQDTIIQGLTPAREYKNLLVNAIFARYYLILENYTFKFGKY